MDKNNKKAFEKARLLRTRLAELFDLPADMVAGLTHMEILGDRQLFLEGHEGILSYGTEQIDINAGAMVVRVKGKGLTLHSMTEDEVRIRGAIECVEYLH